VLPVCDRQRAAIARTSIAGAVPNIYCVDTWEQASKQSSADQLLAELRIHRYTPCEDSPDWLVNAKIPGNEYR